MIAELKEFKNFTNELLKLNKDEKDIFKVLNYIVYGRSTYIQYISNVKGNSHVYDDDDASSGRKHLVKTLSNLQVKLRMLIDSDYHFFIEIDDILNSLRVSCLAIENKFREDVLKRDEFEEKLERLKMLVYSYQNKTKRIVEYIKRNSSFLLLIPIFVILISKFIPINIGIVYLISFIYSIIIQFISNGLIDDKIDSIFFIKKCTQLKKAKTIRNTT